MDMCWWAVCFEITTTKLADISSWKGNQLPITSNVRQMSLKDGRASGFPCQHLEIRAPNRGGVLCGIWGLKPCRATPKAAWIGLMPKNGCCRAHSSHSNTPNEYTSAARE